MSLGGFNPPKHKADVAVPAPAVKSLAVFKLLTVAQAPTGEPAPVHSSAAAVTGGVPPAPTVLDVVPNPPDPYLAVFKSFCSAQLVPFQSSVFPTAVEVYPPKAKAAG